MDIKNKSDKFDTVEEFYDNIQRGGEIEFIYKNKQYAITHSKEGIHFMEAYNYESEKIFINPKELGEMVIDGEEVKEIILQAQILFRCF